jgi:stalled ribosome rescue protein Dom34
MKNTGIWLDRKKALIITIDEKIESAHMIASNLEHFRINGGSGTKFKGGPQDVVQDSKYLEREKHQFKNYFREIIEYVKNTNALAIFGPADTNEKLKKEIQEFHKELNKKIVAVIKSDSMTGNQIKVLVRSFFESN